MAGEVNTTTEAVNALLDGVTAGPWRCLDAEIVVGKGLTSKAIATSRRVWVDGCDQGNANARFIAAARELVPALLARAERAEAFIADFAEFKFTEAPRPHIRDPQDEPDQYVDAQEVWAWQADAKELLK